MSNTLIKVFQREHGKFGYDPVGALTFADPLNTGTTALNDGGEVYVLQPFSTTLGDSCELVTINNAAATLEAQPQIPNATDLLQVRITQLTQVENQPAVVASLDPETLNHLLSRDVSRSVVDTQVVATDQPKTISQVGTTALWVPNVPSEVKESDSNFAEVGLVPVVVGDSLYYINTSQAVDCSEPSVAQILPEVVPNSDEEISLDKGNTVLSFVVDNPDQLGGVLPLSNLNQATVVTTELPSLVTQLPAPPIPQSKPLVKLKTVTSKAGVGPNKSKTGRSLLKGSIAVKQARTVPARTNLCLNKVKKGNKTLVLPPILHKNLSSTQKVFNPKTDRVKNANNDGQQDNQQQSLAVVAISSDKAKDLTEIVVNTSKGKQVFKGKTSDLINAMSALWCANNEDSGDGTLTGNQGNLSEQNNESSEAEDEEDDDGDDQPVKAVLEKLGTSLDSLLNVEDHSWKCPVKDCNKVFHRLHVLKVHILNHYGVRPYKCDYPQCKWSFFTHFRLKRHRETHLKKKDYKCPNCDRSFTTIYNLKTHQKLHQRPAVIECPVPECCSRFQTKRHLEVHMREHGSDHAPFACPVSSCDKRYYSLSSVNSHVRSHQHKENDLRCQWPGCKKIFDKPCRLQAHMRSHTGDKPYRCTFQDCTWAFTSSSKLKRHQQKHTNTRNFACHVEGCGKLFMRPEHLREHILTHSPDRPFPCTYNNCGLRFSAKSSLYVHMKKHRAQPGAQTQGGVLKAVSPTVTPNVAVAAQGPNPGAICNSSDESIPGGQPTETRVVYYCPVEECETSVCSMADIRSHILEVHSPLLTQGDLVQLVSGLHPITFSIGSNSQEASEATAASDGMVSVVQLSGSDVISTDETSVLNDLPEFLITPSLESRQPVDPLRLGEHSSQNISNQLGVQFAGASKIESTQSLTTSTGDKPFNKDEIVGCARLISYDAWRRNHPSKSSDMTHPDEAISSIHPVSCVTDVPGLSELRMPSDVVLGGSLLGTAHDNIAQFLLSDDLGGSALYDSEEGMLSMDSPFEPSTINLRDLE